MHYILSDSTVLEHWLSKYCLCIRITWQACKFVGPHLRYPKLEFQKVDPCMYVLIKLPRWFWCLTCPLTTTNQISPLYRVEMDYRNTTSRVFISLCSRRICPGWNSCSASFISDSYFSIVWNSGFWPTLTGTFVAGFNFFSAFWKLIIWYFSRILCSCHSDICLLKMSLLILITTFLKVNGEIRVNH